MLKRAALFLILLLAFLGITQAEDAVVTRNVYLRVDPSTDNGPITKLLPPASVHLIEAKSTNGYYHVKTGTGDEGWVWGRNIQIQQGSPSSTTTTTPTSTNVIIADTISTAWDRPVPNQTHFTNQDGTDCGPAGTGTDIETNTRKNRNDQIVTSHDVSWSAVRALPDLINEHHRELKDFSPAGKALVKSYEGIPVRVIGYIKVIKPQTGNEETTNCASSAEPDTDWHIALVQNAHDAEKTSFVIETTPRIRASHPKWTPAALADWTDTDKQVRVTGYLLYDPEHRAHMGRYRASLWEVHPIVTFEVLKNGAWVSLDNLP